MQHRAMGMGWVVGIIVVTVNVTVVVALLFLLVTTKLTREPRPLYIKARICRWW
jgi:hypothetical protein